MFVSAIIASSSPIVWCALIFMITGYWFINVALLAHLIVIRHPQLMFHNVQLKQSILCRQSMLR